MQIFIRFATLLTFALASLCTLAAETFDIVIRGGKIVDGTGAPWYIADLAIDEGQIVRIGRLDADDAETVIDATGKVVAPGFIDMMGQTATPMIEDPKTAINLLSQGITTINAGEGGSAAPLSAQAGAKEGYTTMAEYFAMIESQGLPLNVVQTIGHTQVRRIVIGDEDRRPSDEEMKRMRELVAEAMEAGAIGVSTALIYPPAVYAQTREISALAEEAGKHGGRYYTHMRNEGDRLLEAIDEAIQIGRDGGTPVHIFHLKAAGKHNWGKMQSAIARIKQARSEGTQVTADIYPYVNNGLGIAALIHPRHFVKGYESLKERLSDPELRDEIKQEMQTTQGWENWYRHAGSDWNRIIVGRTNVDRYSQWNGESLQQIADEADEDPWETFFTLVRHDAFALPHTMSDANKILAMKQEFVSFCTDVGPDGGSRSASHPRAFGSFPRLLSRYVRDLGAISLPCAIAQASAAAANNVFAYDRGRIAVGLAADVIVFDYDQLADHADFKNPRAVSTGMEHVVVGGRLVLRDGKQTDALPGKVLRGPGFRPESAAWNVGSETVPGFEPFDQHVGKLIRDHKLPGVSVAVADDDQVVFAKGYGYADIGQRETVGVKSLFRIASISKPITAVAVLQLAEKGKLSLDDKILDHLDLKQQVKAAGESFDPRWREISIRHLLQHRGGWDRDQSFDAMFQSVRFAETASTPPPAAPETVIAAMLKQPLDFDPGDRYAYSNFGYCLLGRLIERLSGQTYEAYVQQHVLQPLGIDDMRIGKTRLSGRTEKEVRYYHPGTGRSVFAEDLRQQTPHPYGAWYLEAMDSHGGWLATATDLAKFAAAFNDPETCPILSSASVREMFAPPERAEGEKVDDPTYYYSLGWSNRVVSENKVNHWHSGSLPGTSTIMILRHDGRSMVGLMNSRVSPLERSPGSALDRLLHRATDESL